MLDWCIECRCDVVSHLWFGEAVAQVPVVYGILSVLTEEQARQRSGISSAHNSGKECLDVKLSTPQSQNVYAFLR